MGEDLFNFVLYYQMASYHIMSHHIEQSYLNSCPCLSCLLPFLILFCLLPTATHLLSSFLKMFKLAYSLCLPSSPSPNSPLPPNPHLSLKHTHTDIHAHIYSHTHIIRMIDCMCQGCSPLMRSVSATRSNSKVQLWPLSPCVSSAVRSSRPLHPLRG